MQDDVVKPYVAWYLYSPDEATTLDPNWKAQETSAWTYIQAGRGELKHGDELEIRVLSIHDREREYLPPGKLKRPIEGWQMDWFG